ncbi:MAG: hypothetical protein J07HQX50_01018 [Haloquadratum sp. J07HQX50]|jgi:hypothetical protein|nr:MAG: hypothetical protein J07HQX50_01018 [Haloquadratum sp. J07HQX50]
MVSQVVMLLHRGGELLGRIELSTETPVPRKGEIIVYDDKKYRINEVSHEYAAAENEDIQAQSPTIHLKISGLRERYPP